MALYEKSMFAELKKDCRGNVLMIFALCLVPMVAVAGFSLIFGGVVLAACYPFMKRYTFYPQVVLGAAFSWGMPMAWKPPSTWWVSPVQDRPRSESR